MLLQVGRAYLHGKASGDFAHWFKKRKAVAVRACYRLVSDCHATGFHQPLGLLRIGGQMQIREEDLVLAQHFTFLRLGFLHLDDHFRLFKNLLGIGRYFCAGLLVIAVGKIDRFSCPGFDQYLVSAAGQLLYGRRDQSYPVFERLYFLGYAYAHLCLSLLKSLISGRILERSCLLRNGNAHKRAKN